MLTLFRVARLSSGVIFSALGLLVLPSPAICAPADYSPSAPADTVSTGKSTPTYRDTLSTLNDSLALATLRDSLHRNQIAREMASKEDLRPGRKFIRTSDPTLFANHSGSIGPEYPLGPGDILTLTIWGQKQGRYDLEVDRDGQVQIPSVGVVSLNGTTFGEAQKIFARRLGTVYSGINSGTTQFDLTMQKLKQIRVFVLGEVAKPGGYLLSGNTSSLQAVALAGGPTNVGSERFVQIAHGSTSTTVDLYKYLFLGRRPERDVLQDGDIVQVPMAKATVEIKGAAARPGSYEFAEGETVADLVALSGGIIPTSNLDAPVTIVRTRDNRRYPSTVGTLKEIVGHAKGAALSAGDQVILPAKQVALRAAPVVAGAVLNPGPIAYTQDLSVSQAIRQAGGPTSRALLSRIVIYRFDSTASATVLRTSFGDGFRVPVFPLDSIIVPSRETSSTDSSFQVEIVGAVRAPGRFPWYPGMQAKDLVALAGGLLPSANSKSVRVEERDANGLDAKSVVIEIDTGNEIESTDPGIQPSTLITVASLDRVVALPKIQLTGNVKSKGPFVILNPKERIASVLRRAGGLMPSAYPQGAFLWRPSEGRIPLNLPLAIKKPTSQDNILVQDGDSLYVPSTPATVTVVGQVRKPTQALWRDGEGWKWYVNAAGGFTDSANHSGVFVQYADGSIRSYDQGLDDPDAGATVFVPRLDPPKAATTVEKVTAFGSIITALATIVTVYVLYTSSTR